jgi:hypothetical protein
MYHLSSEILLQEDIPFSVLRPLIEETAAKVGEMAPAQAQTGPAVRHDEKVMRNHLLLIGDQRIKEIYSLISNSIQST